MHLRVLFLLTLPLPVQAINRKQMVSYTSVVLVFLAFMVALIGGVDFGLAKLVMLVFG